MVCATNHFDPNDYKDWATDAISKMKEGGTWGLPSTKLVFVFNTVSGYQRFRNWWETKFGERLYDNELKPDPTKVMTWIHLNGWSVEFSNGVITIYEP